MDFRAGGIPSSGTRDRRIAVKRRLLLDSEVVEFLERLPSAIRVAIWKRFGEIATAPDRFEDYHEHDGTGRVLPAHVFRGYAILFWDDLADRHLKILEVASADEASD